MATAGPVSAGGSGSIGSSGTRKMASLEGLGSSSSTQTMKKTIGHRGIDLPTGETTYKKTTSSALKGAIQLGITHTVGSLSQKPERDVLMQDFEVVESIFFPGEGSNLTPAHHYSDFRFKAYAPIAFRYFREMFGIRPDDYLCSLCSESLIELSNSGASGSVFYVSSDDEFIIKTVQHKEAEFLQKLLPGYFMNLNQNKRTLLPKFYGLYCVQAGGKNIRIVVMNNLLPRAVSMHLKYDLKGSTYKRRASSKERVKAVPTYKDLDFIQYLPEGLLLENDHYNGLSKTIHRDCLLLQSFKIMDYSLLVGVHNVDRAGEEVSVALPDQKRTQGQKPLYCTPIEAIQGEARGKAAPYPHDHMGGIPAHNSKGERMLVFIGIIDILQSYRFVKKLEHSWKALVHDGDTVSVHRPAFYADRFQKFMCNTVFKKIPLKASPSKRSRVGSQMAVRRVNTSAAGPAQHHQQHQQQQQQQQSQPAAQKQPLQQQAGQQSQPQPPQPPATITINPQQEPPAAQQSQSQPPPPSSTSTAQHSPSTETDSGVQSAHSDLLPRTPPHDEVTSNSIETTLSTSSLGSPEPTPSSAPLSSVEVHKSAGTDQDLSAPQSVAVVEESLGPDDVISLSDIVPQTNCH